MKKLLFILPCFLLCFLLVAVPVSAAGADYGVSIEMGSGSAPLDQLPVGYYSVTFEDDSDGSTLFSMSELYLSNGSYEIPDFLFDGDDVFLSVSFENEIYIELRTRSGDYVDVSGVLYLTQITPKPSPAGVFDVFAALGSWVIGALGWLSGLFWTGESLTLVGVLAVCALAFAVIFLLIRIVSRFLHFRG